MALEYTITYQDPLIQVTVRGSPDYLSLDHLWQDIADACNRHDCFKILGVSDSENWGADEAYDHAPIFEAAGITNGHRIAWIEKNEKSKKNVKLAETVIMHRNIAIGRAFDSLADAKRWLLETTDAGT